MTNFIDGVYYCGAILLAIAFLGACLTLGLRAGDQSNAAAWEEINNRKILEDEELEDEND
jgi:hypothetical protein